MLDPFGFPENLEDPRSLMEVLGAEEDAIPADIDLPEGYRWATGDETEMGGMEIPGAMMVTRTFDSTGKRYGHGEADLAVPVATDLDFEPCCYGSTMHFGTGDHEWGCPNY